MSTTLVELRLTATPVALTAADWAQRWHTSRAGAIALLETMKPDVVRQHDDHWHLNPDFAARGNGLRAAR